jgi:hypothetical protein
MLSDRIMQRIATSFDGGDDPTYELGRALAWWMSQEVHPISSTTFESLPHGLPQRPILQPSRWQVFERWAVFLGFAWRLGDSGLIPDPTRAIVSHLDDVLPPDADVYLRDFVDAIGGRLPVIDGGDAFAAYRRQARLSNMDDSLAPPISLSLLRLERAGEISFPPEADAPGITLRCMGAERRHARIQRQTVGEGAPR